MSETDIVERLHRVYREACADWDTVPSGLTDVLLDAKVEIERLRSCEEALLEGGEIIIELKQEIERLRGMSDQLDRLIDALAECIVARQGMPNRDRAKLVLAEIEAQGWRLVPPKENDA